MTSGGRPVSARAGQDEERGQADRGAERPQHADAVDAEAAEDVEHEHQPDDGEHDADDGPAARPVPVAHPQPQHDEHDAQVLQQQGDPDRQRADRGEEGQLHRGHGHHAVGEQQDRVLAEQVPAPAQQDDARGTSSTSAATTMRAVTAAAGLQPDSSSDLANGPELPNAAAEPRASHSPEARAGRAAGRWWCSCGTSITCQE